MRPSSPPAPTPILPVTLLSADGAPLASPFVDLADDAPISDESAVIVSLARFLQREPALDGRRIGVRLQPADKVETLAPHLSAVALVVVAFPKFRDGRGYSTARLLRERYGFTGDIRAEGDVLRDQLAFMLRCGFSSFAVKDRDAAAALAWAHARFSVVYQPAADAAPAIWRRRAYDWSAAAE